MGTIISFASAYAQQEHILLPPLKQIQSGIMLQDIKCNQGLALVIKAENSVPACIRPATEQRLLDHGWVTLTKFETTHQIINQTKVAVITPKILINNTESINITRNSTIGKAYSQSNGSMPQVAFTGITPLSPLAVNYTVSSTEPNSIKILSIGMSPNSLKVGDIPQFTLTWQNISDKPIYQNFGCTVTPLGIVASPSDNVQIFPVGHMRTCDVQTHAPVYPGQTATNDAGTDLMFPHNTYDPYLLFPPGHYQIMKPGILNMTMTLKMLKDAHDSWDLVEIINFTVNVIS